MINNINSKWIFLIRDKDVGGAIYDASIKLNKIIKCAQSIEYKPCNSSMIQIFSGIYLKEVINWDIEKFTHILNTLKKCGGQIEFPFLECFTKKEIRTVLKPYFKLLVVQLWSDRVLLAPPSFNLPTGSSLILDLLCEELNNDILLEIRGFNKKSTIKCQLTPGPSEYLKDRDRRSTQWFRLILCTSFYDLSCFTEKEILRYVTLVYGSKSPFTSRYPIELIIILLKNSQSKLKLLDNVINIHNTDTKTKIKRNKCKQNKKSTNKNKPSKNDFLNKIIKTLEEFSNSYEDLPDDLSSFYLLLKPIYIKRIFNDESFIYDKIDIIPKKFDIYFTKIYISWVNSCRLQRDKDHFLLLSIIKSYLLIYLPRFFRTRDSDLKNYPKSFNDFSCPYFVSMDKILSTLRFSGMSTPKTLIDFITEYGAINGWEADTLYSRILKLDNYFDYVYKNSSVIPGSNLFLNTISSVNYPKISRKSRSVKVPIPAEYYSTLISLLYSMEYLIDHVNGMIEGINYGVLNGELVMAERVQFEYINEWNGLWGRSGSKLQGNDIDLHKLNYTPIVYFNGKCYPLESCKKVYTHITYLINGIEERSIAPHGVRIALLMSEAGIRQHHGLWLDMDRFDQFVNNNRSELEPLLINTDKSHGEWVSAVSHRVIDICRRQKEWCKKVDNFDSAIWYGGKEGSKFGKFNPLFRSSETSVSSGILERVWPLILWTLQDFIRNQLGDFDTPDFVKWVEKKGKFDDGISVYDTENYDLIGKNHVLRVQSSPHSLRVSFIGDRISYLPASIIGDYLTGQSEPHVFYYTVTSTDGLKNHEQLLVDRFIKELENSEQSISPEIADLAFRINASIMNGITENPEKAAVTHGLISLSGMDDDKSGIEVIKAKKYTKLAFNSTHICPFNNCCPTDIVKNYEQRQPCSSCPYAIRSVSNLPALSAAKDSAFELVSILKNKIDEYKKLPHQQKNQAELDKFLAEYDYASNDAYSLEFTERQLFEMHKNGFGANYLANDSKVLVQHFERINLTEADYIIKRLIDINNFPTLDSALIQAKFSFVRKKLLVITGDIGELLKPPSTRSESAELISLIKSLMETKELSVSDIFSLIKTDIDNVIGIDTPVATKGMTFDLGILRDD